MGRSRDRVAFADSLRSIAAAAVLCAHYLLAFWTPGPITGRIADVPAVPLAATPAVSRWIFAQPFEFSLAALGVGIFFVISGFVIPLSLARLTTAEFLWGRAWRIVPTYMAGFPFTVGALALAATVYARPFPYSAPDVLAHWVPGLRMFLRTPNIDWIVWTLEIEICFYSLCAAIAPWLRRGSLLVLIPPAALVVMSLVVRANSYTPYPAAIMLMFFGVMLSFWHQRLLRPLLAGPGALLALAIALAATYRIEGLVVERSYFYAAAIFGGCFLGRAYFPDVAPLRALSAISYPLYVVHGIMGYVIMRIALTAGSSGLGAIAPAVVISTAVATALHFAVERPTQAIGKRSFNLKIQPFHWLVRRI